MLFRRTDIQFDQSWCKCLERGIHSHLLYVRTTRFRKNALIEGRGPVHGILEVYDDQAEMGHFHRVEVISVRADGGSEGEFCKVRLIDCGGHKIVPIVSVLRIHSKSVPRGLTLKRAQSLGTAILLRTACSSA